VANHILSTIITLQQLVMNKNQTAVLNKETKTVWLILFGLLLIRVAPAIVIAVLTRGNTPLLQFDQSVYLMGADAILLGEQNPFNFFPPLQFMFIAAVLYISNGLISSAVIAGAFVGWLTVVGIYLLADLLFDRKTALFSAVLCGIYPGLVTYGVLLTSETLAIFFIVFAFLLILRYLYYGGWYKLAGAGILWGLASQTRGGLHYFIAGVMLALIIQRTGRSWRQACAGALAFAIISLGTFFAIGLAVAPFHGNTALNSKSGLGSVIHGANRITTSCEDYGDILGNIFYDVNNTKEQWPEGSDLFFQMNIMEKSTIEIGSAFLTFILEEPATYFYNSLKKWSCLWSPNQYAIKTIKYHLYYKNAFGAEIACLMISIFYGIVLCTGIWGVAISRDRFRPFFILLVLFYLALIFLAVGNSKLRLPMMPFFIMYSAYFIVTLLRDKSKVRAAVRNKWIAILLVILISNGIIKYREILLTPAEIKVRKIELCTRLGFPKTALRLHEDYKNFPFYNESQKKRLQKTSSEADRFLKEGLK